MGAFHADVVCENDKLSFDMPASTSSGSFWPKRASTRRPLPPFGRGTHAALDLMVDLSASRRGRCSRGRVRALRNAAGTTAFYREDLVPFRARPGIPGSLTHRPAAGTKLLEGRRADRNMPGCGAVSVGEDGVPPMNQLRSGNGSVIRCAATAANTLRGVADRLQRAAQPRITEPSRWPISNSTGKRSFRIAKHSFIENNHIMKKSISVRHSSPAAPRCCWAPATTTTTPPKPPVDLPTEVTVGDRTLELKSFYAMYFPETTT